MSNQFLKAAGITLLALTMKTFAFSQEEGSDSKTDKPRNNQEIVIRKKSDKDVTLTVEIKDNKVFINGKPAGEYNDNNVSVRTITLHGNMRGGRMDLEGDLAMPDGPPSPFRTYSFDNGGADHFNLDISEFAFLGVTSEKADAGGAKITDLSKESSAQKAGLQKGDIITRINETAISNPEDLSQSIHQFKPEDKITVTYMRDGKEYKTTATLGKTSNMNMNTLRLSIPTMEAFSRLKELSEVDKFQAEADKLRSEADRMRGARSYSFAWDSKPRIGIKAQDLEEGKGAKVLDIDDDSPADKAGLKEGDVITEFDGKPVNNADELAAVSKAAKDKYAIKVKIKREDKTQELEIKIPKRLKTADL